MPRRYRTWVADPCPIAVNALSTYILRMDFPITLKPAADLVPYERNARTHTKEQIEQIKELIRLVGFTNPILEDAQGIIAGHGRQMAALEMYAAGEVIHGPGKRFQLPAGMVPVIEQFQGGECGL